MQPVLITIHIVVSVLLILVVLIQSGRSGGISGLFGGGSDALFTTSSQQSGLRTATMIIAGIFMATSIGLTLISSRQRAQSIFQQPSIDYRPTAPSQPQQPAAGPAGQPNVATEAPAAESDKK